MLAPPTYAVAGRGVTEIDTNVAPDTVSVEDVEDTPPNVAVMADEPTAIPIA
jgi:hypothetical protein